MNDQISMWLQDEANGLIVDEQRPTLSRIFLWFQSDFISAGGVSEFVSSFLADEPTVHKITAASELFEYFAYNWNLNHT